MVLNNMSSEFEKNEIEKFDKVAKYWWDKDGHMAGLHRLNPTRFSYMMDAMSKHGGLKDKTVLDIGCGGGILSESFAKQGSIVTGIDLAPSSIRVAAEHAKESGLEITYRQIALSKLRKELEASKQQNATGQKKESGHKGFDVIACSEVMEHVEDLEGLIRDSCALLNPGGIYIFSTINQTMMAKFFALFMAENVLKMVAKGTHSYDMFIKPSRLRGLFSGNDVAIKELKGMTFSPFKMDFTITDNTSVNYIGYGVKNI